MINRILIKNALVFKSLEMTPSKELNIISGASGSGKSVFLEGLLSLFGYANPNASLVEASINGFETKSDLVEDENILRYTKKEKLRFFLNDSQISKKGLLDIFSKNIRYLHHKDKSDISKEALLCLLDLSLENKQKQLIKTFEQNFRKYEQAKSTFFKDLEKQNELKEKSQILKEQITKIKKISPKKGEYEKLLELKKSFSKKEKIKEAMQKASLVFDYERDLFYCLELSNQETSFLSEMFNELRFRFDSINEKLADLQDLDAEGLLKRIEDLSFLIRTYGSEEEALEFANTNEISLQNFDKLEFDLEKRQKELKNLEQDLQKKAQDLSKIRKKALLPLEEKLNKTLKKLKIKPIKISLEEVPIFEKGIDEFSLMLFGAGLSNMSSGEFNRFRLAVLSLKAEFETKQNGVLFFDEIDANVSGEEAEAIALLIVELSKKYQIFAISHQPQLSSKATNHYLVEKQDQESFVKLLDKKERVAELARMISGKEITQEALEHGKKMLEK